MHNVKSGTNLGLMKNLVFIIKIKMKYNYFNAMSVKDVGNNKSP